VEPVRVKVTVLPRLLADLIAATFDERLVRRWEPGDPPADVSIINAATPIDRGEDRGSRVIISLRDRLDDPISVMVDGHSSLVAPVAPHRLHDLVLALAGSAYDEDAAQDPAV
jgi:hypothetical protein